MMILTTDSAFCGNRDSICLVSSVSLQQQCLLSTQYNYQYIMTTLIYKYISIRIHSLVDYSWEHESKILFPLLGEVGFMSIEMNGHAISTIFQDVMRRASHGSIAAGSFSACFLFGGIDPAILLFIWYNFGRTSAYISVSLYFERYFPSIARCKTRKIL